MEAVRVLIVEDSEAIRVAVQVALEARGLLVESRADGHDFEAALDGFAPDLVVLDVMLPGRDGFAAGGVAAQEPSRRRDADGPRRAVGPGERTRRWRG